MKKVVIFLGILILSSLNSLMCKTGPDFLVIGVTKCGTTSLYDWIIQHPQVHTQKTKEIHFFDRSFRKGILWYQKYFSKKKLGQISGEATPDYFWKKGCAKKIAQHCSRAKLIIIFRNPVKRVISDYFMFRRRKEERLPFEQAITRKWRFERFLSAGCYSKHLVKWLSYFRREQIHIMFLEELSVNPEKELNKVFRFLGLKNYRINSYQARNKASYDASQIRPETIRYLEEFYEPFNQKLAKMLGRKLPW